MPGHRGQFSQPNVAISSSRLTLIVDGVEIPVARLAHIIESKARVGGEKDRLFLATHAEALRQLLGSRKT